MMQLKKTTPTFLFYDYETFGIHPSLDKPAQFACIRTDMNLNIIDDPQYFYCFPSDDYLPDPHSVLITGITPQYTEKNGTNEYIFSKKIYNILRQSNTCIVGYNNINFDDEITRNIFYRNFFDPYEWSWKNGNSRWDLLNLLRACYVLRPNGIKWPRNKLGLPSFKLSDLTQMNNIIHLNAHDAISDVYATIEMAKLVKKKQPKLFDFYFKIRTKNELYKFINLKNFKPVIYISSFFGAVRHNMSVILPIIWDDNNSNILIAVDLFKDIKKLINIFKKIHFDNLLIKNLFDLGIVLLYLNRCPMLAPIQTMRNEDYNRLNLNRDIFNKNINLIKKDNFFIENIKIIFSKKKQNNQSFNVDLEIYHSFFNSHDKKSIKIIRNTQPFFLKNINFNFHDSRLKTLLFRYRARNFFNSLDKNEKEIWLKHCMNIFNPLSLKEYQNKIQSLLEKYSNNLDKVILLKKLLDYVLKKYKKLFFKDININ
ncbi:exodeoxyribonuclease I [Buchnera aphidicola (Acyrthosiphon lactucae)]|uniref:Exodeoxyribonuclease I n=1 Tax=Buchnera aphidicola (Acyrthosiphon lactucae) TaxID=1241832 RepID=A0A4D6XT43_9GAMM|nr:exodeoxyribonuclease I [Buchnera aphidicola]QCI17928.1 exodeoxyribonuclease I [Buchnera aphidicola (Acyrthosiphon lactucae)]